MEIMVQMGVLGLFIMIGLSNIYLLIRIVKSLRGERKQNVRDMEDDEVFEVHTNDTKIHSPKTKKKA